MVLFWLRQLFLEPAAAEEGQVLPQSSAEENGLPEDLTSAEIYSAAINKGSHMILSSGSLESNMVSFYVPATDF